MNESVIARELGAGKPQPNLSYSKISYWHPSDTSAAARRARERISLIMINGFCVDSSVLLQRQTSATCEIYADHTAQHVICPFRKWRICMWASGRKCVCVFLCYCVFVLLCFCVWRQEVVMYTLFVLVFCFASWDLGIQILCIKQTRILKCVCFIMVLFI